MTLGSFFLYPLQRLHKIHILQAPEILTFLYFKINYNLVSLPPRVITISRKWFISQGLVCFSLKVSCFNPRYTWKWPEGFLIFLGTTQEILIHLVLGIGIFKFSPRLFSCASQDEDHRAHAIAHPCQWHICTPTILITQVSGKYQWLMKGKYQLPFTSGISLFCLSPHLSFLLNTCLKNNKHY